MKKPTFKTREALLMLLPVLILAGTAIALRGRRGTIVRRTSGQFAFVVDKIEYEPVTAEDASRGISRRIRVAFDHDGPTPPWWGEGKGASRMGTVFVEPTKPGAIQRHAKPGWLICGADIVYQQNGKTRTYRSAKGDAGVSMSFRFDHDLDRYVIDYNFALADVPDKYGQLTLKGIMGAGLDIISFSKVVRETGERVKLPTVSRYSPIALDKVEVKTVNKVETQLTVVLKNNDESQPQKDRGASLSGGQTSFITEKGKTYGMAFGAATGGRSGVIYTPFYYDEKRGRYIATYRFTPSTIPASAGKVTFQTQVSMNGSWPMKISYVVRDG